MPAFSCVLPPRMLLPAKMIEDIPHLAQAFVRKYCEELALPPKQIASNVLEQLKSYPWPGDFQDLEKVIKRAIIVSPGSPVISEVKLPELVPIDTTLGEISLEEVVRRKLSSFLDKWDGYEVRDLRDEVLKQVERPLIELVLSKTKGNQLRAARMLGMNRNTLFKKIRELGIKR